LRAFFTALRVTAYVETILAPSRLRLEPTRLIQDLCSQAKKGGLIGMRITKKEVAQKAGVSTATVSRVFNNNRLVNGENRRRVLVIAKELRDTPNAVGQNLSTQRTGALGVPPNIHGDFFLNAVHGADQIPQQNRYHLFVANSHNQRHEIEATLRVMSSRFEGLTILSPPIDLSKLKVALPIHFPDVLLNSLADGISLHKKTIALRLYENPVVVLYHFTCH
jgi:hypothetical protein